MRVFFSLYAGVSKLLQEINHALPSPLPLLVLDQFDRIANEVHLLLWRRWGNVRRGSLRSVHIPCSR